MTKYERKQQDAKNKCVKLILDNDTTDMIQVHDLLSYLLDENPKDIERAALISNSVFALCRLQATQIRFVYGSIRGLTDGR